MTTKIFSKLSLLFLVSMILFGGACKKAKDPTDGAKLIIDYNLIQTSWSLKFTDVATGAIINNSTVEVTVNGQNKDDVCDITGVLHTDYKYHSVEGFFGCAVPYNVKPDVDNPVIFNLVITCPGYLTTSVPVMATREDHFILEIPLMDYNNLPNGVVMQTTTAQTNNGVLTDNLLLSTPTIPLTGITASFSIPAGTVLKTGDGSLASGNLEVALILFSNMDFQSLQSIPGGMITTVEGSNDPALLFNAGFVALEIKDASANDVVTLEGGTASLEVGVPYLTWNPFENRLVQVGDEVPVWSYYAPTGERKYEDRTAIVSNKAGLAIKYELSHLSWWSFDWLWDGICAEGSSFIFNSQDYTCDCIFMEAIFREEVSGFRHILFTEYIYACLGEEYTLNLVPEGIPVSIEFNPVCSETHTSQDVYYFNNLCADETYNIDLIAGNNLTDVILDVSAYCPSEPDIIIRPTLGAWFHKINDPCWRWSFMTNGYVHICDVEMGETYVVGVYYDGEWEETEVHVTSELYYYNEIELTVDICNNLNY